jgi:hypothetical protein
VFLIALATLALITLPYASDRPVSFDRWWAYAAFAVVGWIGLGLRMFNVIVTPGGLETSRRTGRSACGSRSWGSPVVPRRLSDLAGA